MTPGCIISGERVLSRELLFERASRDECERELLLHVLGDERQRGGGVGAVEGRQVGEELERVIAIGRQHLVDDEVHDLVHEARVPRDLDDQVLEPA